MIFEQEKTFEKWGQISGFLLSYVLFTAILFIIMKILGKVSEYSSALYIAAITLAITFAGWLIKRLLK